MRLSPRRRLQLLDEPLDHLARHWPGPTLVLVEDHRQGRFEVDHINTRPVIGEQVHPAPACLAHEVGGVEGKISTCPEMLPAYFAGTLDDFSLIVRGLRVEV